MLLKEAEAFKETSFSKATMVMRFPAKKNAGCLKGPRDFPPRKDGILHPRRIVLGLPSHSHRVCADGRTYGRTDGRSRDYYVRTKISWIDSLPNFLSNGAPLAGFARRLRYYVRTKISQIDRLPYFLSNGAPLAGFARRLRCNHQFTFSF